MNILAVFAHPDDETVLAGGLLAILAKLGHQVSFMTCTRGEGGEVGDPPVSTQQELGHYRALELSAAVKELGGNRLTILNFVDPSVGENNELFSFTEDQDLLQALISQEIEDQVVDIVVSHGSNGEYGHPGHITVFETVKQAIRQAERNVAWYTCQAAYDGHPKPHLVNRDDPADWMVDVSQVAAEKLAAMTAHRSQHSLFKRRKSTEVGRQVSLEEVLLLEEAYRYQNKNGEDVLQRVLSQAGYLKGG